MLLGSSLCYTLQNNSSTKWEQSRDLTLSPPQATSEPRPPIDVAAETERASISTPFLEHSSLVSERVYTLYLYRRFMLWSTGPTAGCGRG